jgi:acetyl-CoA acetyltransferase
MAGPAGGLPLTAPGATINRLCGSGPEAVAMAARAVRSGDAEHVNPNGGAIALGHPPGASGARLALTAALELDDRGSRRALATKCFGVEQSISVRLESA